MADNKDSEEHKIEVTIKKPGWKNPAHKSASDGPMAFSVDQLTDSAINDLENTDSINGIEEGPEDTPKNIASSKSLKGKISRLFHSWWDNPTKRYIGIGIILAVILLLVVAPGSRYAVLNAIGVRSSLHLSVIDEQTKQPVKNAGITIQNKTGQTNRSGDVIIEDLKLGTYDLIIDKIAYSESVTQANIGISDTKIENISLTPIGTQFTFKLVDWLSGNPIEDAEVEYSESSALSNSEGIAVLNIDPTDETQITTQIIGPGYRQIEHDVITTSTSENEVQMYSDQPHYFINNGSGKFDVFKMLEGDVPEKIIEGTGKERDDLKFTINPKRDRAALISTRSGDKNADGYLLSDLNIINLDNNNLIQVDQSERIDPIGWIGNQLVYIKTKAGASGDDPQRHKLMLVDPYTSDTTEIASSNYFNDAIINKDTVFYAPSDAYKQNPDPALFAYTAKGESYKVFDSEVWTIIQTNEDELAFDAVGDWKRLEIGPNYVSDLAQPPDNRTSRLYVYNNSDGLWIDQSDNTGSIMHYIAKDFSDKFLTEKSGLRYPLQWLSDTHVVFRVVTDSESADYVINIEGGEAQKLVDVADVGGIERWYYSY